jgi:hypothetical protein
VGLDGFVVLTADRLAPALENLPRALAHREVIIAVHQH